MPVLPRTASPLAENCPDTEKVLAAETAAWKDAAARKVDAALIAKVLLLFKPSTVLLVALSRPVAVRAAFAVMGAFAVMVAVGVKMV